MTSYLCFIVTLALFHVVDQIFNIEKYRDVEIPVKSQSMSLTVVPFDRLGMVSYSVFCSNFVPKTHLLRYSTSNIP